MAKKRKPKKPNPQRKAPQEGGGQTAQGTQSSTATTSTHSTASSTAATQTKPKAQGQTAGQKAAPQSKAASAASATPSAASPKENDSGFLVFGRTNFLLMLGSLVLIILGFIIMTLDNTRYGFGFIGLTLGPVTLLAGLVGQFVAILYRPKQSAGTENPSE